MASVQVGHHPCTHSSSLEFHLEDLGGTLKDGFRLLFKEVRSLRGWVGAVGMGGTFDPPHVRVKFWGQ